MLSFQLQSPLLLDNGYVVHQHVNHSHTDLLNAHAKDLPGTMLQLSIKFAKLFKIRAPTGVLLLLLLLLLLLPLLPALLLLPLLLQ